MNDNPDKKTLQTYNQNATDFAKYFRSIGARVDAIDQVLDMLGKENPTIIELGCGDGRDAKEIVARTSNYLGIDFSSSFIELAKRHVPNAEFEVCDMTQFEFPEEIDAIFAFASVLHINKTQLKKLLTDAAIALIEGGIFYISTKYRDSYQRKVQEDSFGERVFYYYSEDDIKDAAGLLYEIVFKTRKTIGDTDWIDLALQRVQQ